MAVIDVRDYGAALDGVTDDRLAWLAAVGAANGKRRRLYLPGSCGPSRISSRIDIELCDVVGDGPPPTRGTYGDHTVATPTGGSIIICDQSGLYSTKRNRSGFSVSGVQLERATVPDPPLETQTIAVDFTGQDVARIDNCRIYGFGVGIKWDESNPDKRFLVESNYTSVIRTDVILCHTGLSVRGRSISFFGGWLWGNVTAALLDQATINNISWFGTAFENNRTAIDSKGSNVSLFGCRFESDPQSRHLLVRVGAGTHTIIGNHWSTGVAITDENASPVYVGDNPNAAAHPSQPHPFRFSRHGSEFVDDTTGQVKSIRSAGNRLEYDGHAVGWGSTPSCSASKLGDVIFNDNPVVGGMAGWICTKAGSPGVWSPFGAITS